MTPEEIAARNVATLHAHNEHQAICPFCRDRESALAASEQRVARLTGEQYYDLLDQMDEVWGPAREIGRPEINAFLESRAVHKPTTRLRAQLQASEQRGKEPKLQTVGTLHAHNVHQAECPHCDYLNREVIDMDVKLAASERALERVSGLLDDLLVFGLHIGGDGPCLMCDAAKALRAALASPGSPQEKGNE